LTPWILSHDTAPSVTIIPLSTSFEKFKNESGAVISSHHSRQWNADQLLAQAFLYKNYIVAIVVNLDNKDTMFELSFQV
jgi:hypothetical protein